MNGQLASTLLPLLSALSFFVRSILLLAIQKVMTLAVIPTRHAAATQTPAITANSPDIVVL